MTVIFSSAPWIIGHSSYVMLNSDMYNSYLFIFNILRYILILSVANDLEGCSKCLYVDDAQLERLI